MVELVIPSNVTTFEEVAAHIQKKGRRLTDFYYNHLGVEVHEKPELVEHEYYLQFGMDFADERPWKSRTWHVPTHAQEEVYDHVRKLQEKHDVFPYHEQTLRRTWITHFVFAGPHEDERGRAVVHAEGEKGKIRKITHTRRPTIDLQ